MDPVCGAKIAFLQKYVPYLANLIKLLANDSEKEGKLAQMQLLYDLLNKPDNSVKIETLEKCEEVLSRVFGNADEKHDETDIDEMADQYNPTITKTLGKCEHPEETDVRADQEKVDIDETNFENVNGCPQELDTETKSLKYETSSGEHSQQLIPHESSNSEESILSIPAPDKAEPNVAEPETAQNTKSAKIEKESIQSLIDTNAKKTKKLNCSAEEEHGNDNETSTSIQTLEKNAQVEDNHMLIKEINADFNEQNSGLVTIKDTTTDVNIEKSYLTEVDESDTFILPDDGEPLKTSPDEINGNRNEIEAESTPNFEVQEEETAPESEREQQLTDVIMQSQTEMLPFKIISAESLAIQSVQSLCENDDLSLLQAIEIDKDQANESENQSNDFAKEETQNYGDLDPLDLMANPSENLLDNSNPVPVENGSVSLNEENNEKDEDDDDVLLIETRSSPICIDSDPEDEENTKQNRSLPIMQAKSTPGVKIQEQKLQRTNARKSTSFVMDTIRTIIKHQNVSIRRVSSHKRPKAQRDSGYLLKKDPKALMETINLIDSDSDDEKSKQRNDDDVIIVSSTQPQRRITPSKKTSFGQSLKQHTRFPSRSVSKPTSKPPTAQSNFLNAVNLQPAPKSNSNPASFSAQLSNKKVIIPNAFYGNPSYSRKSSSTSIVAVIQDESSSNDSISRTIASSSTVSIRQVQDRMLKEWLEGFLTNFASPLQLASHACFVLLQRVLKYRFFQRLKETRVHLNTMAKNFVPESMDVQMLLDLRNVFLENDNLTEAGRRFCRFATNDAFGKPVALTTDSRTGKVTCRTRLGSKADASAEIARQLKTSKPSTTMKLASTTQVPPAKATVTSSNSTTATVTSSNSTKVTAAALNPVPTTTTTPVSNNSKRNRKFRKLSDGIVVADDDDNDYTPYMGELVQEDEVVTERKKSLRTNRTKRKEAGFTYSEDHDDEEFEALAKKIEDKKREELRLAEERELEKERENERKFKKTVAKKTTSKRQGSAVSMQIDVPREPARKKLRLADTKILSNADDDLLTPTWVEADGDDGEVDSLLDFADEPQSPEPHASENDNSFVENDAVPVEAQDSEDSDSYPPSFDVGTNKLLKNTDRALHAQSQSFDFCVHCLRRVPRTVHHYVNEHRSSEVFTSRLRTKDIRRLLTTSNVGFVHLYKGNQQQYAAHCIFCDKEVKFLLPYWFEHFTMHTGEYSFKCTGCHILKPTRSLLTNHLQSGSGCPRKGAAVRLHTFDTKSNQIEAHICVLCNYIQVHRKNVLRHLRTQHAVETVSKNHIIRVVLLQVSGPYRDQDALKNDESQLSLLQHSDEEENTINGTSMTPYVDENSVMMQNDFTDNDDLSFMICGMLDVQTNLSATADVVGSVNTTSTVDNK